MVTETHEAVAIRDTNDQLYAVGKKIAKIKSLTRGHFHASATLKRELDELYTMIPTRVMTKYELRHTKLPG